MTINPMLEPTPEPELDSRTDALATTPPEAAF
jgi:hypothetical protein